MTRDIDRMSQDDHTLERVHLLDTIKRRIYQPTTRIEGIIGHAIKKLKSPPGLPLSLSISSLLSLYLKGRKKGVFHGEDNLRDKSGQHGNRSKGWVDLCNGEGGTICNSFTDGANSVPMCFDHISLVKLD